MATKPTNEALPDIPSPDIQDDDDSIICNQDEAEAILQPALSDAARHLTSQNTPAIEKALALDKSRAGLFDVPIDKRGDTSPDLSSSPETTPQVPQIATPDRPSAKLSPTQQYRHALPSPWQAQPKPTTKGSTSRPSGSILGNALAPARNRSRSAGQEALRRLQKAWPSLSPPTHLLPSMSNSFFSSSNDKASASTSGVPSHSSPETRQHSPHIPSDALGVSRVRPSLSPQQARGLASAPRNPNAASSSVRPRVLRRVTSDESHLYHSLSRTSSLGDDEQFQDVREMVNIRFMALKDSLPDVPNFKMPSLPKLYSQARKSTHSLGAFHSPEPSPTRAQPPKDFDVSSKDGSAVLDRVLASLTGDLVIMGGYRGSVLRSAEPPHQQVWAPVKLGLNMRKVNLEVGLEDEDEERMEETIKPDGMLKHIGPVDVSRKFIKRLRSCDNARSGKLRIWDYGYDWRLSPHLLSRKLQEYLQKLPSNQEGTPAGSRGALVISHSLGGIITRHAVNQRPDLFSGVLYCGTPQRCVNILNPLRHGDVVLLNEKLLTTSVNFSMRTSFVFLPEDGFCFVDKNTGEEYPIDFYDPQEWVRWHLSPCMQPALPPRNRPQSSSFSSFLPNSLRTRADSKSEKWPPSPTAAARDHNPIAPQLNGSGANVEESKPSDLQRKRYLDYLTRTLAATRKFRSELAHSPRHQEANAYPPHAVLYGKSIPTVYAAQVTGREAICYSDAYDDLLFRPGDGVVLAKEAMLPEGYSIARGGRVCTERGHITMLGDLPAMGKALEALVRGRRKGIGMGTACDEAK
ncbi:esterase [Fusarium denticulatum]|uniref:Esterase n=1 Tax=Fusarium denticulatum TaxID=48507 RepID=A0A8H5XBH3_9HYPO|nr:esterase [Fusarium denticulatum]